MFHRHSISKLSVALLVLLGVGAGMLYLKRYAFRPPSEAELRERVQSKNLLPVVKRVVDRVRAGEHVGLQDPEGVQIGSRNILRVISRLLAGSSQSGWSQRTAASTRFRV